MSVWMQTASGLKLTPLAIEPEMVRLEDIAHSLGNLCRFNGHCLAFYSVAEHCVRLSYEVPREDALAGLLHDAGEMVLGDHIRPLKGSMAMWDGQVYIPIKQLEDRVHHSICHALAIPSDIPVSVHAADLRMVMTEARDLMLPPPEAWQITHEPYPWTIWPWTAPVATMRFLRRYREITGAAA